MNRILLLIVVLLAAAQAALAAPLEPPERDDANALQSRIETQSRKIASLTEYSAELQRSILRAGFDTSDVLGKISPRQKLERILPGAHFHNVRLVDALERLSRASGLDIREDWQGLAEAGIDPDVLITCNLHYPSVQDTLLAILGAPAILPTQLRFEWEDANSIKVSIRERLSLPVVKTCNVSALLPRSPNPDAAREELVRVVLSNVASETWKDDGGTIGEIVLDGNKMKVTQTLANQSAIEDLLEMLDDTRHNAHRQSTIAAQDAEIEALNFTVEKLTARCRGVGIRPPSTIEQAMEVPLPDVKFVDVPLWACLGWLSKAGGKPIIADWSALAHQLIHREQTVTLQLHQQTLGGSLAAMSTRLSNANTSVRFSIETNGITLHAQTDPKEEYILRTYDISDLLPPHGDRDKVVDNITTWIRDHIDTQSWQDNGGTASMIAFDERLVIKQSPRVQLDIKNHLDAWRRGLQQLRAAQ